MACELQNGEMILLGAGGHARVLCDTLRLLGWLERVRGVVALPLSAEERALLTLPHLGTDVWLESLDPERVTLVNGIGSVGETTRRRELFERCQGLGFGFSTLIHPTAWVAGDVALGMGAQLMARALVQTGVTAGENVLINSAAVIEHDCRLASHVHVASAAVLSGGVRVGVGTHVGAGAVVRQGIVIGACCVIGAGAVVVRDVRDGAVVMGSPAGEKRR
ncbi:MAG: acetyltransferase [Magnetococcus sp. YQC-9]